MEKYTIYCTEEQTKKALELGANLDSAYIDDDAPHIIASNPRVEGNNIAYLIPTADQMIGWLEEQGLLISILHGYETYDKWTFDIDGEKYVEYETGEYDTRKEATLAAIDAALDYLSKNKVSPI